eukprot:3975341-Pyramimonas_sp.AAC.1
MLWRACPVMVWPYCARSVVMLTIPRCGPYLYACGKPRSQASAATQQEDGSIQCPLQFRTLSELAR